MLQSFEVFSFFFHFNSIISFWQYCSSILKLASRYQFDVYCQHISNSLSRVVCSVLLVFRFLLLSKMVGLHPHACYNAVTFYTIMKMTVFILFVYEIVLKFHSSSIISFSQIFGLEVNEIKNVDQLNKSILYSQ